VATGDQRAATLNTEIHRSERERSPRFQVKVEVLLVAGGCKRATKIRERDFRRNLQLGAQREQGSPAVRCVLQARLEGSEVHLAAGENARNLRDDPGPVDSRDPELVQDVAAALGPILPQGTTVALTEQGVRLAATEQFPPVAASFAIRSAIDPAAGWEGTDPIANPGVSDSLRQGRDPREIRRLWGLAPESQEFSTRRQDFVIYR